MAVKSLTVAVLKAENSLPFKRGLSFSAHHKLASDGYDVVFKTGKRYRARCFQFVYTQNPEKLTTLGLAISKKNVKSSVKRNLCKRLSREYFRLHHPEVGALQVIVMANPPAYSAAREELHACLAQFWQSLKK